MIVNILLENLTLRGVTYGDGILKYNGYRLELRNSELSKLTDSFDVAQEFFFQDSTDITKETIQDASLDVEEVTIELANLLFDNMQKAVAVHLYTLAPFQDFKEDDIIYDEPISFIYMGNKLEVYYQSELITYAKEVKYNYYENVSLSGLVDRNILDYLDFVDIPKLIKILRMTVEKESDIDISAFPKEDIKFITKYNAIFDDLVEKIENNELFNYDKLVDQDIDSIDSAKDELEIYIGDAVWDEEVSVGKWRTQRVIIFETF